MNLIVDTSVWSYFLRRENPDVYNPYLGKLQQHLENQDCIHLPGVVLMELLDGLKSKKKFQTLLNYLEPFPLIENTRADFEEAAVLKSKCRRKGFQASSFDFLIASSAILRNYPLLSADKDFETIAKNSSLELIPV